jgi:hypothetical protein
MRKLITILALLASARLAFPAEAAAPTVALGNAVLEVAAGQTAPLSVAVTDVQDLYGVEIHLRFDPAVVQVADADPAKDGIQVAAGDFLSADFVAQNRADNQAGTVDYAVTQVNPNEPKSGSGTLLVIRFQGGAAGRASQLEVTNGILTTRDGELIPVTFASGEVRVTGSSAGAGNATATPTAPGKGATGGDAPTATRAFTNTPIPAAPNAAASAPPPSAEPTSSASPPAVVSPAATQSGPPAIADTTPTPLASVGNIATSAPSASLAQAPSPVPTPVSNAPTPESIPPTPALVAKTSLGDPGNAILEPGTSEKTDASESAPTAEQPASSWLLIGAAVLIGLAGVMAAVAFWLSSRRKRV